jgi:aspartate aminotransferase-like enzyme
VSLEFDEYMNYCSGSSDLEARTLRALTKPYNLAWGDDFVEFYAGTLELLGRVFRTTNEVLPIAATIRGAWDAAICSVVEPGDKVLIPSNGGYWHNFAIDIVETYGGIPIVPEGEPYRPVTHELVEQALARAPDVKAAMLIHVETDGGIVNPHLEEIGTVLRERSDALYIVDAATSLAADDVNVDAWGADICFSGSHKGLASPAGLAFLAISERAWDVIRTRATPIQSWYTSLLTWKEVDILNCAPGKISFSFPVPLFRAVRSRLDYIVEKGLENVIAEHEIAARALRSGVLAMGLELVADCVASGEAASNGAVCRNGCRSFCANSMSFVRFPPNVQPADFERLMARRYGLVTISMPYNQDGFIVGTINAYQVHPRNLLACLGAIGLSMKQLGVPVDLSGLEVADSVLSERADVGTVVTAFD